jgi:predicted lipoprotein with Yx(FWY)xxD motif
MLIALITAAAGIRSPAVRGATATATQGLTAKKVKISTRTVRGLGTVLVNARGLTLYMFVPDKRKRVTCVSTCAAIWPPVKLHKGQEPIAAGKAKATLLGSDPDPAGGRVVTYHGWPLYLYVGDNHPGTAKGQALDLNGGFWYALAPSGKVIRKKL